MKNSEQENIKSGFTHPDGYSPLRLFLVSMLCAVFIIYPNIVFFSMERKFLGEDKHTVHLLFFIFRYFYFTALVWVHIFYNLRKIAIPSISKRFLHNFLITTAGYLLYVCFSLLLSPKTEWFSGLILFQFFVIFIFCSLIGHVAYLYNEQRKKEQEIEQLRIENLESRYNALTNQINPHFFFNSLNGLSSVIRKKNVDASLEYVNKLSDVFRYILQSDRKGIVTLGEELDFVRSFLYMMEIRFAKKLELKINVPDEKKNLKLPVLSLLPLIENITIHNTIDSDHKMDVTISLNQQMELTVTNPVYPKLTPADTNGTGLRNLENRFLLLMNKPVRIENDGSRFTVFLPLKQD